MKNVYIILAIFLVSCSKETIVQQPDIVGSWQLINTFDGTFNIDWSNEKKGMIISDNIQYCDQAHKYNYDGKTLCVENHVYKTSIKNDTLTLTENNFISTYIKQSIEC